MNSDRVCPEHGKITTEAKTGLKKAPVKGAAVGGEKQTVQSTLFTLAHGAISFMKQTGLIAIFKYKWNPPVI